MVSKATSYSKRKQSPFKQNWLYRIFVLLAMTLLIHHGVVVGGVEVGARGFVRCGVFVAGCSVEVSDGVKVGRGVFVGAGVLVGMGVIVGVSVGGRTGVAVVSASGG